MEVLDDRWTCWDLRVRIGRSRNSIRVTTETLEQVPPRHGRFRGEADLFEMIGTIDLTPEGTRTKVVYSMSLHTMGPLSRILDNFMRSRLKLRPRSSRRM